MAPDHRHPTGAAPTSPTASADSLGERTPAAVATDAAAAPRRTGLLARLFGRRPTPSAQAATPEVAASVDLVRAQSALTAVLDEIGAARRRPFSREPGAAPQITYRT
jgi:hypothetical protein